MKVIVVTFILFTFVLCPIASAAMPDDLVLYMSFDKGTISGKEVKDLSNYGNNGAIVGSPKQVAGYNGEAIELNGSSDSVEITTSESLAKTAGEITMEAWLYTRADGTAEIISKWDNTMNGIIHFEAAAGGNMRFGMRKKDDSFVVNFTTGSGGLNLKTWVHVAEVYDGKKAIVYFDGAEIDSRDGAGEMRENENAMWWIGSMYTQGRWFNGLIDEVCIWSRALSVDEVKKSMAGTLINAAVDAQGKLATTWAEIKK